ncbi:predicted protein [Uncinocarpus reesii 1704]|uniref:Uncharacterized protein n=1 Tax=Uncinocarpus reesii (strain UAMH 1704) TaxID=336963 RepID=C4JQA1_UNCRE|nr:uncharacterized protein UREG_04655 [Uncinocarpus reesii 1704]EEP79809.1 predicted protein [Uncinocarpus reesii 1704]
METSPSRPGPAPRSPRRSHRRNSRHIGKSLARGLRRALFCLVNPCLATYRLIAGPVWNWWTQDHQARLPSEASRVDLVREQRTQDMSWHMVAIPPAASADYLQSVRVYFALAPARRGCTKMSRLGQIRRQGG